MTKKEKSKDSYLRTTFNRDLRWYKKKLKKQKGRCAVCRRKPKTLQLAVDHWHKLAKLKIITYKDKKKDIWRAYVEEIPEIKDKHVRRMRAKRLVRLVLLKMSVRGLLCWACNMGLRRYFDDGQAVLRAGHYLVEHQKNFTPELVKKLLKRGKQK